jgi:hypothetical protein
VIWTEQTILEFSAEWWDGKQRGGTGSTFSDNASPPNVPQLVHDSTQWSGSPTHSALHEIRSIHPTFRLTLTKRTCGLHDGVEVSRVSLIEWQVLGAQVTANPVSEPRGYA